MRVSGAEYLRVSQLRVAHNTVEARSLGTLATAPARSASSASAADLETSPEAKDIQRVVDRVASEADIREDIVANLRERIASGTYNVTGEQIGEMMIRRFLADRVR